MKKGTIWAAKLAAMAIETVVVLTAVFVAGVIALVAAAILFAAFLWLVGKAGVI